MNETTEQRMERRQGSLLDRAIQAVAPERGFRRAMAREALHHFGYDGAQPGTLRGSSGSVYKNASPESWKMQRDRTDIMWDARDMERNFCLVGGILDRTSQYTCSRVSYQSRTGVKETDDRYEDYFASWMERADLTNRFNFRQLDQGGRLRCGNGRATAGGSPSQVNPPAGGGHQGRDRAGSGAAEPGGQEGHGGRAEGDGRPSEVADEIAREQGIGGNDGVSPSVPHL